MIEAVPSLDSSSISLLPFDDNQVPGSKLPDNLPAGFSSQNSKSRVNLCASWPMGGVPSQQFRQGLVPAESHQPGRISQRHLD